MSRHFKQLDVARRLGQGERLPSFWLRRKVGGWRTVAFVVVSPATSRKDRSSGDRFAQTKPLFPSLADAQVQPEVCAQPSPLRGRGL